MRSKITRAEALRLSQLLESCIACRDTLTHAMTSRAEKEVAADQMQKAKQEFTEILLRLSA